jgi:TPR repeat protein
MLPLDRLWQRGQCAGVNTNASSPSQLAGSQIAIGGDRLDRAVRHIVRMSRAFSRSTVTSWLSNLTNLKQQADQGDAIAQWQYGLCLYDGKGVSIDMRNAAHYFKLSNDQGDAGFVCS